MAKRKLYINPTLYITEGKVWTYFAVNREIYKLNLSEQELKDIYGVIQIINRNHTLKNHDTKNIKRAFRILETLGAVTERIYERQQDTTLIIRKVKHVVDVKPLNEYCQNECLRFSEEEEGLFAYLTDSEVILSKNEIQTGHFRKPNATMQELFVQIILKNKQEILDAFVEHTCLAIPLFSYSSGVKILKENIGGKDEVSSYLHFQPWNTDIMIDGNISYPLVIVKCVIDNLPFEAAGMDTNYALYQIYLEHKSMREEGYV